MTALLICILSLVPVLASTETGHVEALEGLGLSITLADDWETEDLRPGDANRGIVFVAETEDDCLWLDISTASYEDLADLSAYGAELKATYGEEAVAPLCLNGFDYLLVNPKEGDLHLYILQTGDNAFLTTTVYGTADAFESHKAEVEAMLSSLTAANARKANGRVDGVVTFYDQRRGFGYIEVEDCTEPVFVHYSALRVYKPLTAGQKVTLAIIEGRRGLNALDVLPA